MPTENDPERWARLRFAIIGHLLAAPPPRGELHTALATLAAKTWTHPVHGTAIQFSFATLERWYYAARQVVDPVATLQRRPRDDAGRFRGLSAPLIQRLEAQYRAHTGWTAQLHYDNLQAQAQIDASLAVPSYATVRRYLKARGWHRQKRPHRNTPGARQAQQKLAQREVRSYEADYTHSLWHADFHHGSRPVLLATGRWVKPLLLCFMDDHSRLVCHLQWYLEETAEVLVHGLCQALQKRGLPRALMTDNGAAMQADEFQCGLHTLGILHETTLPYSPYQNAKQETFWATLEGRLMAMLESQKDMSLERLNLLTQAWVEQGYHRSRHGELGSTPLQRYLDAAHVGRDCPGSEPLRQAFRRTLQRKQRRSDGTISLDATRFEIPSQYRHLETPTIRYARWNLSAVELIDPRTLKSLCPLYPLDKSANAAGQRRALKATEQQTALPLAEPHASSTQQPGELPPLLRQYVAEYAATGQPPAYLPSAQEKQDE